jgi:hypothetical protein
MKCPECQTDNPAGAKFCASCGASLKAASVPEPAAMDYDFELQPEAHKKPDPQMPPGLAPRLDLDAEPSESEPSPSPVPDKKAKKKPPEKPKTYMQEAKIMMGTSGLYLLVAMVMCGWQLGLPAIVGFIFGMMAFLEASKVEEFYASAEYPSAEKSSVDAGKLIKIGIIAAVVTLILSTLAWIAWFGLSKIMGIFGQGHDLPKD